MKWFLIQDTRYKIQETLFNVGLYTDDVLYNDRSLHQVQTRRHKIPSVAVWNAAVKDDEFANLPQPTCPSLPFVLSATCINMKALGDQRLTRLSA